MIVKTNMEATRALNQMTVNQTAAQKHMAKISTGMKIRDAQDDPSAYAISESMRVRIRALEQAHSNTQNGAGMLKTADKAVSSILDAVRTLKEKAIDSANDTNVDENRLIIQKEFNQLVDSIDDDAIVTFNNISLVDGTRNNAFHPAKTILLNQNLSENTATTSKLTDLANRADESLGIQETDFYNVSYVMNGRITSVSGQVADKTLEDILEISDVSDLQTTDADGKISAVKDKFDKDVFTPDKGKGLYIASLSSADGSDAVDRQISGFTISITDRDGNVRKYANAYLDQFSQYQRAENQTGDQALSFHVGADTNISSKFALSDMRAEALGLKGTENTFLSVSTREDANATINVLDNVLNKILNEQTTIGAALSRLDYTMSNLTTTVTNDQSSYSVIRDADIATEMTGYVKNNMLRESAQAMLAQANQFPNNVLSLVGSGTE